FILSKDQAERLKLPKTALKPLLARMRMAPGAVLTRNDLDNSNVRQQRCLLLDTRRHEKRSAVIEYLSRFGKRARKRNKTFRKRRSWHQPQLGKVPEAFLSYMNKYGPRIVINSAHVQSANNIHRLYLKTNATPKALKLAVISLCSAFGQVAAECL